MKYLLILAVILFLARIDFILKLFDRANENLRSEQLELPVTNIPSTEFVPLKNDFSTLGSNRELFFTLMRDFSLQPSSDSRIRAINFLKDHSYILDENLDKNFELQILIWREQFNDHDKEISYFMADLTKYLKGQNLDIVMRLFSSLMDQNIDQFIKAYLITGETNCKVARLFNDDAISEEKFSNLLNRDNALNRYLKIENLSPEQKNLAQNCRLQISLEMEKLQ